MAQTKLIWDVSRPDKITWLRSSAKIIDRAVLRGRKAALLVGGGATTFLMYSKCTVKIQLMYSQYTVNVQ